MPARPRRSAAPLVAFALVAACVPTPAGRPSATPAPVTPPPSPTVTIAPTPSGPTPSPSFIRPTPTPLPTFFAYTVQAGDTLSSIARTFATTPRSIAFWNRDAYPSLDPDAEDYEPNRITIGWTLLIQPGVEVDEMELPTPAPSATGAALRVGYPPES